ncbi:putative RNA methylase [Mesorhizobium metallidurans STM 2683]|uniref:Putative RNA methylase n=1 Tax=Mesorhizobium metallidurans STM 2683 TaxID=1297569 RepID=M5EUE3_9HYPH|nr:DNA methyltransferase [Mesorhizobium metallidurans]CCV03311.1 putative RNA methylase [Mesorhizobium metallidurans STM 2683]
MNFQSTADVIRREATDKFAGVDWSFAGRVAGDDLESIHPYPAKFIPEIPGTILDRLPVEKGLAVLDPFVGSGTTLVECQRRGVRSIGIDLNPIACLISRVKTRPVPANLGDALQDVIRRADKDKAVAIPSIPNLLHWFSEPVAGALAQLVHSISDSPKQYSDVLKLALSSVLVRVSNQESDTRYAAVSKNVSPDAVYEAFRSACQKLNNALINRDYELPQSTVLERDTLAVEPSDMSEKIGAVITSPPYPNAYEYWLYHKYRMWWLGYDPLWVKDREIGARAHFFKVKRHTASHFVEQMQRTFSLIDRVLSPNGYACFVVGRSKIHGEIVDNAQIVENAARSFGFKTEYRTERIIARNRKSFNLSHANIKTETIIILSR